MACRTCDLIRGILLSQGLDEAAADAIAYSTPIQRAEEVVKKKVKRKASKYQREFGIQLKKLKKKHPRTAVRNLMKRAHRATRRVMR